MTCHTESIQCLNTYQLGAVSGEEEGLQRDFKTVNRLLGTNVYGSGNRFHSDCEP